MPGSRFTQALMGIKVAKEVTPGAYVLPTTALYLERGTDMSKVEFGKITVDPMSSTSGTKRDIVAPGTGKISYTITQKMAADKAAYSVLLETCNFAGTALVSPAGVSYEMKTAKTDTLSIDWIDPRATVSGKGGKGGLSIKCEINKPVEMTFAYSFKYQGETLLVNTAPDNAVPTVDIPAFLYMLEDCTGYTINGVGGHIESFEIDWGASMVHADTSCPSGAYCEEYAPTLKLTQSLTEENEISWDELQTQGEKNIILGLFEIDGTKRGEIRIPKAVANDTDKNSDQGRFKATRSFACLPTNGDDNIQIVIFD
ncbi:MAG TPA: hypothetical protein CFH81_02165 [Sulfurovum sp. UBA12169]|nr:MAG TPA: hypothetical protein CFH81_02165 [Sulfurovum sp. UBA12169]